MLNKIKNHFTQKREIRTLRLDTLAKINHITTTLYGLTEILTSTIGTLDADDIKGLVENMNKIANNPDLTSAYYSQVSKQAHEERMAEMNKERENI